MLNPSLCFHLTHPNCHLLSKACPKNIKSPVHLKRNNDSLLNHISYKSSNLILNYKHTMSSNYKTPFTNAILQESLAKSSKKEDERCESFQKQQTLKIMKVKESQLSNQSFEEPQQTPQFMRIRSENIEVHALQNLKVRLHSEKESGNAMEIQSMSREHREESMRTKEQFMQSSSEHESLVANERTQISSFSDQDELLELKEKMNQIQHIATTQIKALEEGLLQEKKRNEELTCRIKMNAKQMKEMGINTEDDGKDEEIQALKEALINHIKINKRLVSNLSIDKENQSSNFYRNKNQ